MVIVSKRADFAVNDMPKEHDLTLKRGSIYAKRGPKAEFFAERTVNGVAATICRSNVFESDDRLLVLNNESATDQLMIFPCQLDDIDSLISMGVPIQNGLLDDIRPAWACFHFVRAFAAFRSGMSVPESFAWARAHKGEATEGLVVLANLVGEHAVYDKDGIYYDPAFGRINLSTYKKISYARYRDMLEARKTFQQVASDVFVMPNLRGIIDLADVKTFSRRFNRERHGG